MTPPGTITVHHIPVCPFCQRLEILLELKGQRDAVRFEVVDITRPRDPSLLARTRGATALPVLETARGELLRESLVLMGYLDAALPGPRVAQADPYRRAVEELVVTRERELVAAGYALVLNQAPARRAPLTQRLLESYRGIDALLRDHAPDRAFLFDDFAWAEAVFAPVFQRFWFLDYYEGWTWPDELARVRRWRDACVAHPRAQQTSFEEIVKVYYDYAKGAHNGNLLPGRARSSFALEPSWRDRPLPPADKYGVSATDRELGLV